MNEIYKSPYRVSNYDDVFNTIISKWLESDLDDAFVQHELFTLTSEVEKHKPSNLIIDISNFDYQIPYPLESWAEIELVPRLINANLRRIAIVGDKNFLKNQGLENTLSRVKNKLIDYQLFDNEQQALVWLSEFID